VKRGKKMADEKEKTIEKGQERQPEVPEVEDVLSEKDMEKVAGGVCDAGSKGTCTFISFYEQ